MEWHSHRSTSLFPEPMIEAYLDFCLGHCRELLRGYRLTGCKTEWEFPTYCVQQFILCGQQITGYKFLKLDKLFLKDALKFMEANSVGLWQDYRDNPEYKKELQQSWVWISFFKRRYRNSPQHLLELDLAFGASECLMLLFDRKLL